MIPGATAFTRTPLEAHSIDKDLQRLESEFKNLLRLLTLGSKLVTSLNNQLRVYQSFVKYSVSLILNFN